MCKKTAESIREITDMQYGAQNDDRPIEWYVKMTESIDRPRHDIDTETTDMLYM